MSGDQETLGEGAKPALAAGAGRRGLQRREFLRGVARAAAFGGLGAAGAVLARRARRARGTDGCCASRGVCPACGEVAGCPLPQAELARRAGRG